MLNPSAALDDLRQRAKEGQKLTFKFFRDGPFSQWHRAPFRLDGDNYPTAEHYLMARKARHFKDDVALRQIMDTPDPRLAKQYGRMVKNFKDEEWAKVRFEIAVAGNFAKFSQHALLKQLLLNTGVQYLVEASVEDTIWGIGMRDTDTDARNPCQWKGTNLLGFVLINVRMLLR